MVPISTLESVWSSVAPNFGFEWSAAMTSLPVDAMDSWASSSNSPRQWTINLGFIGPSQRWLQKTSLRIFKFLYRRVHSFLWQCLALLHWSVQIFVLLEDHILWSVPWNRQLGRAFRPYACLVGEGNVKVKSTCSNGDKCNLNTLQRLRF